MKKAEKLIVCAECRGPNIQVQAWVDPNSKELVDWYDNVAWCADCEIHVGTTTADDDNE